VLPSDVRRTGIRWDMVRLGRWGRRLVRTNEEVVDTRSEAAAEAPRSSSPYPPIRVLAAIGDGRTVALVSLDGTMCWLPVPSLDSATVFASLLLFRARWSVLRTLGACAMIGLAAGLVELLAT